MGRGDGGNFPAEVGKVLGAMLASLHPSLYRSENPSEPAEHPLGGPCLSLPRWTPQWEAACP